MKGTASPATLGRTPSHLSIASFWFSISLRRKSSGVTSCFCNLKLSACACA